MKTRSVLSKVNAIGAIVISLGLAGLALRSIPSTTSTTNTSPDPGPSPSTFLKKGVR